MDEGEVRVPDDDMVAFFEERTRVHVQGVQRNGRMMAKTLEESGEGGETVTELLAAIEIHDASKWEEPERTPYVWLTHWHRQRSAGISFEYPPGVEDAVSAAIRHHKAHNTHHVEAHQSPDDMSDAQVAEMVCDWAAIAQEMASDPSVSPRTWFESHALSRWSFSPSTLSRIEHFLRALEHAISSPPVSASPTQ